jgi:hypothetical protein
MQIPNCKCKGISLFLFLLFFFFTFIDEDVEERGESEEDVHSNVLHVANVVKLVGGGIDAWKTHTIHFNSIQ